MAARTNGACTYSLIGQIETGRGGKRGTYRPHPDIVDALAQALDANVNEARLAAGYAPAGTTAKPSNLKELIEALEGLGLPVPELAGGWERLVQDSGGFEEAIQRIYLDLQLVMKRSLNGLAQKQALGLAFNVSQPHREDGQSDQDRN